MEALIAMNLDAKTTDIQRNRGIAPDFDLLMLLKLSVRARNTLKRLGVIDENKLMLLKKTELQAVRHCGKKTVKEIINFRNAVKAGRYPLMPEARETLMQDGWVDASERKLVFNALVKGLSKRAQTTLERLGVDTIDDFLLLSLSEIPCERGAGVLTTDEIFRIKNIFMQYLHESKDIPRSQRLDGLCEYIYHRYLGENEEWHLDPAFPLASLRSWVASTSRGIDNVESAVIMRMGLSGEPAMTLEKVGSILGLTRERVRQLNKEFAVFSEWIVAQRRLDPIVAKIARIVADNHGRMSKVDLLARLGHEEAAMQTLEQAVRLLELIAQFETWTRHGLSSGKWDVFLG